MFQNKSKQSQILISFIIFLFIILLSSKTYPFFNGNSTQPPLTISLIISDSHTKLAVNLLKDNDIKKLNLRIYIYPRKDIKKKDLTPLLSSDIVFIDIMGRSIFYELKAELKAVISGGAKIYAVAGRASYNEELKEFGILYDQTVDEYYTEGGYENLKNMLFYVLKKDFGFEIEVGKVKRIPEFGIYDRVSGRSYERFEDYYSAMGRDYFERPLVGIVFYRSSYATGQLKVVDAIIDTLHREGFSVLPVFGFPGERAVEKFFFDENGQARVRAVIGLSLKVGLNPRTALPVFERLGVPILNAISLYSMNREEWEKSPVGLDIMERSWQIAQPELGGIIQPTVVASRERFIDPETGESYIEDTPIQERIERLVARVKSWINLQDKRNSEKRVAIIYYNYPPGKQNIGASYLNVLPESLWSIYERLKKEGYRVDENLTKDLLFEEVLRYGRNIGNWAPREIDELARSGRAILLPVKTYREWFNELPQRLREWIIRDWGLPEDSKIMVWKSPRGEDYFVIPGLIYGNLLLAPQPSRGWEQDVKKLYHNVTLAPHHQYVAFYLYLKRIFRADAVIHLGTHGTHEWLSGKEIGFTESDPPEALISDLPNIYPYIVDNLGEGTQAKRRGLAVIIDHMTPPFDRASLNKDLRELISMIDDYKVAREKSLTLAEQKLKEIEALAQKMGLLTDLGLKSLEDEEALEELENHLREIAEQFTPFGLHVFGRSPSDEAIRKTAEAMVSIDTKLSIEDRERMREEYEKRIRISGEAELDSLVRALNGRYVRAGTGNDPLRNPESLPTGKNFFSFDPSRIPSRTTYELGMRLAKELLEEYRSSHGEYPSKLTFNLWGTETMRHEGVMEAQILYILGVRPKWDERGRIYDLEVISGKELGRPRPDVVIVPSGLYRDLFPNLLALLDKAISLVRDTEEEGNLLRENILRTEEDLTSRGLDRALAKRLASVRIFTVPPGAYGTNLDKVIPLSHTWDNETDVASVFFMRMGHLYGQGFWGESLSSEQFRIVEKEDLNITLFKRALSGTKIAVHSRSTNTYGTLDNDDFFQYLGGTGLAIRVLDGKTPELYITNLSNPTSPKQETLARFMGRELRARYLNPNWIVKMLEEGYAGARFIDKVIEHLWGWQVVTPEIVDSAKWQEMYEVYVLDRYGLNIRDAFRKAGNLWAYQSLVARMLEVIRKGYWKPEKDVSETLAMEFAKTVREVGLACCDHTCNNPLLKEFTQNILISLPLAKGLLESFIKAYEDLRTEGPSKEAVGRESPEKLKSLVPHPQGQLLKGYELEELRTSGFSPSSAPIPYLYILLFGLFVSLILLGLRRARL